MDLRPGSSEQPFPTCLICRRVDEEGIISTTRKQIVSDAKKCPLPGILAEILQSILQEHAIGLVPITLELLLQGSVQFVFPFLNRRFRPIRKHTAEIEQKLYLPSKITVRFGSINQRSPIVVSLDHLRPELLLSNLLLIKPSDRFFGGGGVSEDID